MNTPLRILAVDDEPAIRRLLNTGLSRHGYRIEEAEDGRAALAAIQRHTPDAMVLDLGLPGIDGFEVIRAVRESGSALPIIVLSVRADEAGKVRALDMGADDYVTKPFGMDELLARLRAALRHRLQQDGERPIFKLDHLNVDLVRRIVKVAGADVKLTPREYDLLRLLVTNAGKVVTHKYILNALWSEQADIQQLRIYVRTLRQKIEADPEQPRLILTEQGVGYRLRALD